MVTDLVSFQTSFLSGNYIGYFESEGPLFCPRVSLDLLFSYYNS